MNYTVHMKYNPILKLTHRAHDKSYKGIIVFDNIDTLNILHLKKGNENINSKL